MVSPLISVVIPAYNHEQFISEALASALEQEGVLLEVVVVDDGSTDGTWERLADCRDSRVRLYRQDNQGSHRAINFGLSQARGEYLAILNSDDRFHPQRLARLLDASREQDYGMVLSDIRLIDRDGAPITTPNHWWRVWYEDLKENYRREGNAAKALLSGNFAITTSNLFFHRTVFETLGPFRPYRYVLDYDYVLRAAHQLGHRLGFLVGEPLLDYRLHGNNTILKNPLRANLETDVLLRRYIPKILGQETGPALAYLHRIKRLIVQLDRDHHRQTYHGHLEALHRAQTELDRINRTLSQANEALDAANQQLHRDNEALHVANVALDTHNRALEAERDQLVAQMRQDRQVLAMIQAELSRLQHSPSFRLGRVLLAPARWLRRAGKRLARTGHGVRIRDTAMLRIELAQRVANVDVVSFDIFDTLLERVIEPPDHVKLIACRALSRHLSAHHHIEKNLQELLTCRAEVESRLRRERQLAEWDHECRFSDLAAEMARVLLGRPDPELAAWIVAEELRIEGDVLYVKPEMEKILTWLRDIGKRVIAISDMYLDEEHLQILFQRQGLADCIDRLYVSSTSGVGKYSGRLFEHVLAREQMPAHRLLHIGDNRHSDSAAPAALGIASLWLDDARNNRRRVILRGHAWLAAKNPYWKGRHLLQLIEPPAPRNFYFDLGFSYLGPIFCTFILGVIEKAREHRLPRLFFLAREGELFLRLFERLAPHILEPEARPSTEYLYVSRKSTAPAAMHQGLSYETTLAPLHNPNQQGLTSICKTFDLPPAAFATVARRYGYAVDQRIEDWDSERYRAMIADPEFQAIVIHHAREQRALLGDYLRQSGFFDHERVGLVDIGWNGSSQRYFQDAFGDEDYYPHVFGLYLGWVHGIKHRLDVARNTIYGLLYDVRRRNWLEDGFSRFEELFEEGARALHATTLCYRRADDGRVIPVLKEDAAPDRQAELAMNPMIAEFHAGVLAFCDPFARALHLTGYSFDEVRPFVMTLAERVVSFPTRQEAEFLMQVTHSEDFGFDGTLRLQQDRLRLTDFFRPRTFLQRLRGSNWLYGTGRLLGMPGLNTVLRYLDVSRSRS